MKIKYSDIVSKRVTDCKTCRDKTVLVYTLYSLFIIHIWINHRFYAVQPEQIIELKLEAIKGRKCED